MSDEFDPVRELADLIRGVVTTNASVATQLTLHTKADDQVIVALGALSAEVRALADALRVQNARIEGEGRGWAKLAGGLGRMVSDPRIIAFASMVATAVTITWLHSCGIDVPTSALEAPAPMEHTP